MATIIVATVCAFAGTVLSGCGSKKVASTTPARPERAFVRLDVLIAEHPLQLEARRLQEAEDRLRGLRDEQDMGLAIGANDGYVLPALSETAGERQATAEALDTVRDLRVRERERLGAIVARELADYARRLNTRLERLVAQRRAELMAANAEQETANERAAREQAQAQLLAELSAQLDKWIELVAGRAVLEAQLYPKAENVVLPPIENEEEFAKEIAALKANPQATKGISLRARLEVKRLEVQAGIDAIETKIAEIKRRGRANIEGAAADVRAQRIAEIEAKLDALRDDADVLFLLRQQRGELAEALRQEAVIAGRVNSLVGAGRGGNASGPVTLSDVSVVRKTGAAGVGIAAAADRIAGQRRELVGLIREDVRDSVRDEAQTRSIDVQFVEGTGTPVPKDRTDRTKDFSGWVRWEGRSASAGGIEEGRQ